MAPWGRRDRPTHRNVYTTLERRDGLETPKGTTRLLSIRCSLGRHWSVQGRRPVLAQCFFRRWHSVSFPAYPSRSSRSTLSTVVFPMPREPHQCSQQRRARDAERHRTHCRRTLANATDPVVVARRDGVRGRTILPSDTLPPRSSTSRSVTLGATPRSPAFAPSYNMSQTVRRWKMTGIDRKLVAHLASVRKTTRYVHRRESGQMPFEKKSTTKHWRPITDYEDRTLR